MTDQLQPGVRFYLSVNQERLGPLTEEVVREKVRLGECTSATLGWKEGDPDWKPLGHLFPYLFLGTAAVPPPVGATTSPAGAATDVLGPRVLGLIIDFIIMIVGCVVLLFIGLGFAGPFLDFIFICLYPMLTIGSKMQATFGMKAAGIKMTTLNGGRVEYSRAFFRSFMAFLLSAVIIGWLWAFWDPQRQTLHDKFAGTLVVRA